MIFGIAVRPVWVLAGGVTLLALLVFQILVGMRKIKFGRKTFVYHKYVAFVMVALALVHGFLGMVLAFGWRVF
jgi:hypothetical protein